MIYKAETELKPRLNIYGEVTSGFIELIGPITTIKRGQERPHGSNLPWTPEDGIFSVIDISGKSVGRITFDNHDGKNPVAFDVMIVVTTTMAGVDKGRKTITQWFIALEQLEKTHYRRIGMGQLWAPQKLQDDMWKKITLT
jgi:hypothetical protein